MPGCSRGPGIGWLPVGPARRLPYLLLRLDERLLLPLLLLLPLDAEARPEELLLLLLLLLLLPLLLLPFDAEARLPLPDDEDFDEEEELRDAIACSLCGFLRWPFYACADHRVNLGGSCDLAVGGLAVSL